LATRGIFSQHRERRDDQNQELNMTEYSNVKEEAKRLGISQRLLWRWIKARRIPSFKCGRRVILRPEETDAALNRFRASAIGEAKAA
jgi:excisionase family DNA binding protein